MPDPERIAGRLEELWRIAHGPGGGADRPAFSPAEAQAMRLVAGWARQAGLEPGLDRHGNLWGLPQGGDGPLVTAGSHVDTVPDGGRYDGALGTVLGLELAHELPGCGLLVCTAEEAPRFGAGTIGSRLLVGSLPESALSDLFDADGISAAAARERYLGALRDLPRVQHTPVARLRAHAEVHVAQRRALRELGVVTKVASPRRLEVTFSGRSGHSGEVSMQERRDALAAAAEFVLAVERAARDEPPETVATVGTIAVAPGAVSVIPGRARLGVDVRGISSRSLRRLDGVIRESAAAVSDRRGVGVDLRLLRDGEPVALDRGLADAALLAARQLGVPATETWSGAGHDAQHLAAVTATLLLFVPLHGGESHTPQEGAEMDEIVQAGRLAAAVLGAQALDSGPAV
ncbi:MAG TPA: hydantoinase/carbamoylase family amidase [Solirubrobacteraceae bacterium]